MGLISRVSSRTYRDAKLSYLRQIGPGVAFTTPGAGINELCDKCLANGKVGKQLRLVKTQLETDRKKITIKELQVRKLQENLKMANQEIDVLRMAREERLVDQVESSFREKSFVHNESQISLLNDLVNTSRVLSSEMDIKFRNDMSIMTELKEIRDMLKKNDNRNVSTPSPLPSINDEAFVDASSLVCDFSKACNISPPVKKCQDKDPQKSSPRSVQANPY